MRINTSVIEALKASGVDYVELAAMVTKLAEAGELDESKSGEKFTIATKKNVETFKSVTTERRSLEIAKNAPEKNRVAMQFAVWHTLQAAAFRYIGEYAIELPEKLEKPLKEHYEYRAKVNA